ncbi:patatin-like phospholipase family protein [Burkholderia ambifaria]|uniref:patatin-like phospholipase family protein n=1 Tax=Burkholderia ambifaria TaxID=152480 RepID=UPI001E4FA00D|nr:patatin-like phospholipase family protein [Burkholderia ambifaria]
MLKALEARGIPVELVAGTSAGSVVGALYASGMSALQINKIALDMDQASISDWALPFRSRGLLQGVALQNFLNKTPQQPADREDGEAARHRRDRSAERPADPVPAGQYGARGARVVQRAVGVRTGEDRQTASTSTAAS